MNKKTNKQFHKTVLLNEAIKFLKIKPGELYIDCTVGGAGHSEAICKKGGELFGLDRDKEAVEFANKRLQTVCPNAGWKIVKGNFANLKKLAEKFKLSNPAGILLDLGPSLHHFKGKGRGFSFLQDEKLDMRMDKSLKVTAQDLVNGLYKGELNELFCKLGEEQLSLEIADAILVERKRRAIETTKQLARIVSRVYKKHNKKTRIHPATKVFLALRIAVNDELNNLKKVLPQALNLLKKEGRLVVIAFHGLEDKIVKNFFKKGEKKKWLEIVCKKPVVPTREEIAKNLGARSAKMRTAEKI